MYECKNYLATGREAERLLQFILLKGNEQGYKDVLEVCRVMGNRSRRDVDQLYIDHLIENCHDAHTAFAKIAEVMADNEADGVHLCQQLTERAAIALKLAESEMEEDGVKLVEEAYIQVLSRVITTFNTRCSSNSTTKRTNNCSKSNSQQLAETISHAQLLVNAMALKNEFGLRTKETGCRSGGSIRDQANNKQLLTQFIIRLVGGLEENVTCVGGEKDSTTSR